MHLSPQTLRELYLRAYSKTRDSTWAEDLVQELLLSAVLKEREAESEVAIPDAWFAHELNKYYARDLRRQAHEAELEPVSASGETAPETGFERIFYRNELRRLERLCGKFWEPLLLSALGWKTNEIAGLLKLSQREAREKIRRARELIKQYPSPFT